MLQKYKSIGGFKVEGNSQESDKVVKFYEFLERCKQKWLNTRLVGNSLLFLSAGDAVGESTIAKELIEIKTPQYIFMIDPGVSSDVAEQAKKRMSTACPGVNIIYSFDMEAYDNQVILENSPGMIISVNYSLGIIGGHHESPGMILLNKLFKMCDQFNSDIPIALCYYNHDESYVQIFQKLDEYLQRTKQTYSALMRLARTLQTEADKRMAAALAQQEEDDYELALALEAQLNPYEFRS